MTLVIVAAVFGSVACMGERERQPTAGAGIDGGSPSTAPLSPVEEYLEFAATAGDPQSSLRGDQMAEGLRKLAGALATLNVVGPDLLIDLRIGAEHILLNPASAGTAAVIRDGLVAAADSMERGTGTDVALRAAAESIRPDRPLIEQQAAVLHFFQRAADAVQTSTTGSPGGRR